MTGQTLGEFQTYVIHGSYNNCEPYTMSMHPTILRRIATHESGWSYTHIEDLASVFDQWLCDHGLANSNLIVAGKNIASFDLPMLKAQCPDWDKLIDTHRRVLDPAMLFWNPAEDEVPPNTRECQERSGQDPEVKHTTLEDAQAVAQMIFIAVGRRVSPSQLLEEHHDCQV